MQADEALRPLHRSQQLGHRNRRRIRCEDRIFLHDAIERRVHLFLLFHILDDGLDDDVAIGKIGFVRSPLQPRADRVFLLRRDAALLDWSLGKLRQRFLDPGKSFVEIFLLDFEDSHVESGRSANLCDSGTHQTTTEYANFFDFHYASR